jgi:hypothetical protein
MRPSMMNTLRSYTPSGFGLCSLSLPTIVIRHYELVSLLYQSVYGREEKVR